MNAAERREALARARLYLCVGIRDDLPAFLDAVLGAGVDVVQLREKHAPHARIREAAPLFRAAAAHHDALFVVNDFPEIAAACGADGVHVGQEDVTPQRARAVVGPDVLVGRSTHSAAEIARALDEPVDYLGVGPVSPTPTKPGRAGVGLELVGHAAATVDVPFFVTGGMSPETISAARAAGATRFVVVRAITEAPDPAATVAAIRVAIGA